jgi:hypothetical protein
MKIRIRKALGDLSAFIELDDFIARLKKMPLRGHLFYVSVFLNFLFMIFALWVCSLLPGEL